MRTERHDCSDELLLAILTEDSFQETETILDQIEQCPKCRHRLEELSADPSIWQRIQRVLAGFDSSTGSFRARENAGHRTGYCTEVGSQSRSRGWGESMARQLLGPASHPEMMGRIGRYEVERLIGSGGMGIVFKAIDTELNRPVAIKVLAPYLAGNGAARQRFLREAKAAAAVVHEHVVPIYNVESDGESPFLVMHYVAGESLQARIDREGPLELCEILRIGMQVSSGLEAAHLQGLVHRDIKPSNILLEQGVERSLITDFGLARTADDASLTNTGYHAGTPQYMSPEQARGDAIDFRSDLFSLGSMLYAMCAGRPPFRAETAYGILRKITDTEPRSLQEINPRIPAWLEKIVEKLMAKGHMDRFASAAEVASLLEECLAHVQRPTTHPLPKTLVAPTRSPLRFSRVSTVVLLCSIPCLAVGGWFGSNYLRSIGNSNTAGVTNPMENSGAAVGLLEGPEQNPNDQKPQEPKTKRIARSFSIAPDPADRLRGELSLPLEIDTQELALEEVLKIISEAIGVSIDLNQASLTEADIDRSQTISVKGKDTARGLLRRICNTMDLAYVVHEEHIEVGSKEYGRAHPVLRYYDLAYVMNDSQGLADLIVAIESLIEPNAWKQNGGDSTITVVESVLVVRATESIHIQLEQLLSQVARSSPGT